MTQLTETPRIVVGVDGSPAAERALAWAMGQAAATGGAVEAVLAWEVPASYGVGPTVLDGEDLAGSAGQQLDASIAAAVPGAPAVSVRRRVVRGHAADVLVHAAKGADLLVVGSHGRGRFVGALLGSVSQYCVQHATCPVVVVRADS